ncbi:MAG: hypothetical protein QW835_00335 [Candidatus Hadarchaeum sp.]
MFAINEGYPAHPNTIVLRNEFYPSGLREIDVYNYYRVNKTSILKECKGKEVMFFIAVNENEFIVKRKYQGEFIFLDRNNYEKFITGRTVSVHCTMGRYSNFGIVDIDYHDFQMCKHATKEVYDFLKKSSWFKSVLIKYTGKNSFHVICHFGKYLDIDAVRRKLIEIFENNGMEEFLIYQRRNPNRVNLDLSSNKFRGGYICTGALSVLGLKSMYVPFEKLYSFKKEDAVIPISR